MGKNEHHYVPQFYLRAFSQNGKQINLYNVKRNEHFPHRGIRGQCSKHRFYGPTDAFEDLLMQLESVWAPGIRAMRTRLALPSLGSDDHKTLLLFVAFQMLRTAANADRMHSQNRQLTENILAHKLTPDQRREWEDSLEADNPMPFALTLAPQVSLCLADLKLRLVIASDSQYFVTSDNPACKYNQYYEAYRMGVTGALHRGLQVFLPLSPSVLLMLYDGRVYRAGDRSGNLILAATDRDMLALNTFQAVNAEESVYYRELTHTDQVARIVQRALPHRVPEPMRLDEAFEVGDESVSLLHGYELMPNMHLNLSFLSVKREARRIPWTERTNPKFCYRENRPAFDMMPDLPIRPGRKRVTTYKTRQVDK